MRYLNPDIALHDAFRQPAIGACLGLQLRHGDRVVVPRGLLGRDRGCVHTRDSHLGPSTMLLDSAVAGSDQQLLQEHVALAHLGMRSILSSAASRR